MDVLREAALAFSTSNTDEIIQKEALKNLEHWLTSPDLKEYVPYIEHVAANKNFDLLLDCFWRMIPFGTGGRRGAIGAGPNRINPYTINLSVQGHCKYLREVVGAKGDFSVVVAHDVRQFFDMRGLYENVDGILKGITSLDMAKEAAKTYAANGIKAYVVGPLEDGPDGKICKDKYISTPELSFLIRRYGAAGGLNISASHNHPDDNGGKFYNKEGGQEIPPDDEALLKVVETVDTVLSMPYSEAREKGLIQYVSKEDHQAYLDLNMALSHTSSRSAKIGFSPLCGTGMTTVYPTLKGLGYTVEKVEAQCDYDGSFAPVVYRIANPEVPESMQILEQVCVEKNCDIGFSTDPDADRLGIVVSNGKGGFEFVNGNEIGVLLIQSIVSSKKQANLLPENPLFINTLVTSSLQKEIAQKNGCQVVGDLMVGFKYIGDVLKHVDQNGCFPPKAEAEGRDTAQGTIGDYVFGTEESHGYLLTPEIRDKDACGAAVHLAGLASELKDTNKTFDSYLRDIYKVYGYHRNSLRSLVMEGIVGLKRIKKIQDVLRKNPPKEIAGYKVINFVDNHVVGGPLKSTTDEASRNVLLFELQKEEGKVIRLVVRPSGTEPKTKLYVEVPSNRKIGGTLDQVSQSDLDAFSDSELDSIIEKTNEEATLIGNQFIKYLLGKDVLGDVYNVVPEASLLVSDLVAVDHKINLCTEILPKLQSKIENGENLKNTNDWLDKQLHVFGEDARGLVADAAVAWAKNRRRQKDLQDDVASSVISLFV